MIKHNLLLIGFGPHAQGIYYPFFKKREQDLGIKISYGVDLLTKKNNIEEYLAERNETLPMYYVTKSTSRENIEKTTADALNKIVEEYKIKGVIISTEPLAHYKYASWALKKGLNILMDKPISIVNNASTSEKAANKIIEDFSNLEKLYKDSQKKYKRILFSTLAQRRYHPAFLKIRSLIHEVYQRSNCPITSIQSFHSDGQWRLPSEIIDIKYHSFNNGYGKCSHSGYHSLDIVPWFIEAAESDDKRINNVDIFSNFTRPIDFITQINTKDYKKIFTDFPKHNHYGKKEFEELTYRYGEVDAFNSFAFKHDKNIITLGSLNFVHNGFSQRGWLVARKNLDKGNGRVRHESYTIEQGPFQAIHLNSYQQGKEQNKSEDLFDMGGEFHLDIHVFRNHNLFSDWKSYEKYSIKNLANNMLDEYSRGHQENARRECILEFANFILGKKINYVSDFNNHIRSTKLLSGVYLSAAKRFNEKNPMVNIPF